MLTPPLGELAHGYLSSVGVYYMRTLQSAGLFRGAGSVEVAGERDRARTAAPHPPAEAPSRPPEPRSSPASYAGSPTPSAPPSSPFKTDAPAISQTHARPPAIPPVTRTHPPDSRARARMRPCAHTRPYRHARRRGQAPVRGTREGSRSDVP